MPTAMTDPLCGVVLDGRYRVEAALARGGMSMVYVGTDTRLDRTVAIKVMSRGLVDNPAFVTRFTQEARAAARLAHPNVVGVYDQGTDGEYVFLVMQLVEGRTLRDLLREQGRLAPELAVTVLEAVLSALAAAHRAGLIHRDVKPENILLADDGGDGGGGAVKVADFGLARAIAQSTTTATAGAVLGTISYVAPEQVTRGTTDARTDVYSAGILLYELLTGQPPYTGETAISVAYRHVHDDVPPPSALVPGLPAELDALTRWATRRDPAQRPADAAVFLAQLRDLRARLGLRTVPIPARPDQPGRAARHGDTAPLLTGGSTVRARPDRRRRNVLLSLAAAVVLLGAGIASAGWWFGSGRYTSVPKLSRLSVAEARTTADNDHLHVDVLPDRVHSENVPVGEVVSTDPGRGHRVLRDSTIGLRLSSGPERFRIPADLVGAEQQAVRKLLADIPVRTSWPTAHSDTVPEGRIVSISPAPGTPLRRDQPVTLVVSSGPQTFPVPNETGAAADTAKAALVAAGLQVQTTTAPSDTVPAGQVISQDPAAGDVIHGRTVTLTVSSGPALVTVPDVTRQTVDGAQSTLAAAGLTADVRSVFGGRFGLVLRQSPAAGTQVPKGTTVTLSVF